MHDAGQTGNQRLGLQIGVVPQRRRVSGQKVLQRLARLVPRLLAQAHEGVEGGREEDIAVLRENRPLEQMTNGRQIEDGISDGDANSMLRIVGCGKDAVRQVLNGKVRIGGDWNPRHDLRG